MYAKIKNLLTGDIIFAHSTTEHPASSYGKEIWVDDDMNAIGQVGMPIFGCEILQLSFEVVTTINDHENTYEPDFEGIINEFAEHGWDVTPQAIAHNFAAWEDGFKSGFLDEENGYFLFSPSGDNPFSLEAIPLNGKDWQKTYVA